MKIAVYIASPYTLGDQAVNVRRSLDVAEQLAERGYAPVVPLLSHFWHLVHSHDKEFWLDLDLQILYRCDVLLRLPGESSGADNEVGFAVKLSKPVFYSIESLLENLPANATIWPWRFKHPECARCEYRPCDENDPQKPDYCQAEGSGRSGKSEVPDDVCPVCGGTGIPPDKDYDEDKNEHACVACGGTGKPVGCNEKVCARCHDVIPGSDPAFCSECYHSDQRT